MGPPQRRWQLDHRRPRVSIIDDERELSSFRGLKILTIRSPPRPSPSPPPPPPSSPPPASPRAPGDTALGPPRVPRQARARHLRERRGRPPAAAAAAPPPPRLHLQRLRKHNLQVPPHEAPPSTGPAPSPCDAPRRARRAGTSESESESESPPLRRRRFRTESFPNRIRRRRRAGRGGTARLTSRRRRRRRPIPSRAARARRTPRSRPCGSARTTGGRPPRTPTRRRSARTRTASRASPKTVFPPEVDDASVDVDETPERVAASDGSSRRVFLPKRRRRAKRGRDWRVRPCLRKYHRSPRRGRGGLGALAGRRRVGARRAGRRRLFGGETLVKPARVPRPRRCGRVCLPHRDPGAPAARTRVRTTRSSPRTRGRRSGTRRRRRPVAASARYPESHPSSSSDRPPRGIDRASSN